jgi:predicted metallopeptidase
MKYEYAPDLQLIAEDVCRVLFPHINIARIKCFRSYGTSTRHVLARCHSLGKLMQKALGVDAFYPIEFLAENFDNLNINDKTRIIVHELMHIPKSFGGGFRHHDFVCRENIDKCYKMYLDMKSDEKEPETDKWF